MICFAQSGLRIAGRVRRRLANEDALTARRQTQALRAKRPAHLERVHTIETILTAAAREHLQLIVGLGERPALERHPDLVRSRGGEELDVLQPSVHAIERAVLHLIVELHVLFAADDRLVDQFVVERHHQRILELHAIAPDVGGHVGDVDGVFAVRGEIDVGENPAARAERQTGHVRELRAGAGAERPPARTRIGSPDRLYGNGTRRDDVLLDERRRHLQGRRDVVESLGHIISRENGIRIELHGQKIANRVRVFLAIEPVQDEAVRHVCLPCHCRTVQGALEPGDERVGGRGLGLFGSGRRHHAPAQLAHGLLEHVRVLADAVRRESLEADAGGLGAVVVTRNAVLVDRRQLLLRV